MFELHKRQRRKGTVETSRTFKLKLSAFDFESAQVAAQSG